jgi:hypothetical protein
MAELNKVQFYFAPKAMADLDDLQEDMGTSSRAETVRTSIRWLQWTVNQLKRGNKICMQTEDGTIKEVMVPFLSSRDDPQTPTGVAALPEKGAKR